MTNAPVERYLRRVRAELRRLEPARQEELLQELRAHLHDSAAAAGRDPADAALQAALIARLGPARRVGRELFRANSTPDERRLDAALRAGRAGAWLVPLIVLAALLLQQERLAELTLVASQAALLLVVPALYLLCRPVAPRLSALAALLGLLGGAAMPAGVLLSLFVRPPAPLLPADLGAAWVSLTGAWAILASGLLLARRRARLAQGLPDDGMLGPALLGPLWGAAWVVLCANTDPSERWAPLWALNLAIGTWLLLHLAWCLWMGFVLGRVGRGPHKQPARQSA
jgi:hypothetical protein